MTPRARLDRPAAPAEPFIPACPTCEDRGIAAGPLYSSLGELAELLADNRIALCACPAGQRARALVEGLDGGSVLVRMPDQKVSLCKVSELVKLEEGVREWMR